MLYQVIPELALRFLNKNGSHPRMFANIYCLFQTRNLFLPHCQDEEDSLYRWSGEKEGTGSYLHAYTHTTVQMS